MMQPDGGSLKDKSYLGDAVYVGRDDYGGVVLWTSDGIRVTNQIVFEMEVMTSLIAWLKRLHYPGL